jgi:hypothetical protein
MNEQTLQLLRQMVRGYLPLYPGDDNNVVECGYCSMQSNVEDFFKPESHGALCAYAAGLRHLAAVDKTKEPAQ